MSFLPLNVFAEEGQEAGETPEITENSTPAEGETDGDAVPAEGKETTPEEPETTAPENQENTAGKETEQPAGGNTEAAPAENKEENVTLLAAPEKKAVRTIMMYVCGSNLESGGGYASDNLKQILGSSFSEDEDVRLIVMTGGRLPGYIKKTLKNMAGRSAISGQKYMAAGNCCISWKC
ncbi:MAG: hypothetical protein IKG53_01940 [Solobacterium sp.]|nr:hypothetical protein [Solobacterium sp.]